LVIGASPFRVPNGSRPRRIRPGCRRVRHPVLEEVLTLNMNGPDPREPVMLPVTAVALTLTSQLFIPMRFEKLFGMRLGDVDLDRPAWPWP
jgi:hypothetical protein